MTDILNKAIVLVLNRNWQAINIRTPQNAFCQMAANVATALEIDGENEIRPVGWADWISLPIREILAATSLSASVGVVFRGPWSLIH